MTFACEQKSSPDDSSGDNTSCTDDDFKEKKHCWRLPQINIEPAFFLLALFYGLYACVANVFNYYKICMIYNPEMPNSEAYCKNPQLPSANETANEAQSIAANTKFIQTEVSHLDEYMLYVNTFPSLIASFLIGTWSDRHGRKPFLVIAMAGCLIYPLILLYSSTYIYSPTWILLIGRFLDGCFANGIFLITSASIRDQFGKNAIFIRLTILSSSFNCGRLFGSLVGSFVMKFMSYSDILMISMVPQSFAFLYVVFVVKETLTVSEKQRLINDVEVLGNYGSINAENDANHTSFVSGKCSSCKWTGIMAVWQTIAKQRPNGGRCCLLIGLIAFLLFIIAMGSSNLFLLFVKLPPLEWSNTLFVRHETMSSAIAFSIVPLIVIFCKKVLKLHDLTLVLLGLCSNICHQVAISLSTRTWEIFASTAIGVSEHNVFQGLRSYLVQLVHVDETAKLFALIAAVENVGPLIATTIFNNLYPATISFFPGLMFDVAAGISFLAVILVLFLYLRGRKPASMEHAYLISNSK